MILLKKITKSYSSGFLRKKKTAVENVSLDIQAGEIFGIIGANGAGKSTIIKMILGFIRPDTGSLTIENKQPSDPQSRRNMGYLPENPYFYHNLTVIELLRFSATASGLSKSLAQERINLLLENVDLYEVRKRRLKTYSKGMLQRAGICSALVHDPKVVVLDEPMSGLDPLGRKMVLDLIIDLQKEGKTILFCSHILNDVERICDRVAIMDKGRLKNIYSKSALSKNTMEELFLKEIRAEKP
nr:ABC transporter ATP-binding protein [uncultured Desulfobacter sp.]